MRARRELRRCDGRTPAVPSGLSECAVGVRLTRWLRPRRAFASERWWCVIVGGVGGRGLLQGERVWPLVWWRGGCGGGEGCGPVDLVEDAEVSGQGYLGVQDPRESPAQVGLEV